MLKNTAPNPTLSQTWLKFLIASWKLLSIPDTSTLENFLFFQFYISLAYAGGRQTPPENPSKITPQNPSTHSDAQKHFRGDIGSQNSSKMTWFGLK